MSDLVVVSIVIAIAVIVALFLFRTRLGRFAIKAGPGGVEADLTTQIASEERQASHSEKSTPSTGSVVISGNIQRGVGNAIDVSRGNVDLRRNIQEGNNQSIKVEQGE